MAAIHVQIGVFVFICSCLIPTFPVALDESKIDVYTTLKAIYGLLDFYRSEYRNMNLDGVFGLRVIEGLCSKLIEEHNRGLYNHLPDNLFQELKKIQLEAKTTANMALPYIQEKDPSYFKQFTPLIGSAWRVFHSHRIADITIQKVQINIEINNEDLNEDQIDICMSKLIGTDVDDPPCTITNKCWQMMMTPQQNMYILTHQVLYFSLAEQVYCTESMNQMAAQNGRGDILQIQHELCSSMLKEVHKIILLGIPLHLQDLFMEQLFICGSLGYIDFIKLNWLKRMLSWQFSNGCFGEKLSSEVKKDRKLLRTKELKDGCESHMTSVAGAALIVYLRYFIDPGPPGFQVNFESNEEDQNERPYDDFDSQISNAHVEFHPVFQQKLLYFIIIMVFLVLAVFLIRRLFNQRQIALKKSFL
ncbi:UPF0764 protein C16orf89 homolog [Saccoglossus kowalevskii]|uniref:UPF0764 protein C16orf89 homolog n=1 Tax=Saccoglossus kowalevskii TaxID=10224 RepID=A0ABM0H0Z4_SACKO|nr:PREDICTED: UPF0764 protein C16orf89 homolog [Saccoglossus kowalevskii]